jgi:hypothetical protein
MMFGNEIVRLVYPGPAGGGCGSGAHRECGDGGRPLLFIFVAAAAAVTLSSLSSYLQAAGSDSQMGYSSCRKFDRDDK